MQKPNSAYKKVCSTCGKILPEDYVKKTCSLCLEKAKARHTVEKASKELQVESEKFVKNLAKQGVTLPKIFSSFSVYQESWRSQGIEKSWEDFQKDREEAVRNQIRARADNEADSIHRGHKNNKRFLSKFLRPDLYPWTKEESCRQYRMMKLGLFPEQESFLTDHIELDLCATCKEWLYQLEHGNAENHLLQSEPDEDGYYLVAYIIYKEEIDDEQLLEIYKELGDSIKLELYDKRRGKKNVFCDPNKIKQSERYYPPIEGCNLWGSGEPKPVSKPESEIERLKRSYS